MAANGPGSWIWWDWVHRHLHDKIVPGLRQHAELTVLAVGIGLAIAFPLAVLAHRHRAIYAPLLGVTGWLYTIPSLALFAFFLPWTGLTTTTSELGLVSYTLLILVRNIVTGLDTVPDEALDAARGMGFTSFGQLVRVEIPLAVPSIIAGIRIATVTTVGLVTVTAVIGQGGLGQLIFTDGFQRDFRTPLVVGLVLTVVLATAMDLVLRVVERAATPWARARADA